MSSNPRELAAQFARFLGAGGANTVITYLLYLGLLAVVGYQIAYAIAFVTGVLLSYWLNLRFVFRRVGSRRKLLRYPLVYLVQYALGALLLGVLVELLGVPEQAGPILVIIATLPVTFLLSRWILAPKQAPASMPS